MGRSVYPTVHHRGPSYDQTQFSVWWKFDSKFGQRTTAGSCDDRVWSTGKTMRGTGAIVFSTRVYFILPETVELYSCEDSWGRSTCVSVLTSSLMWYSVCCGESDIVLVVGVPHIWIYSANRRWIQLLDEHSKTSSPMRAAVAWDNYLPSAEHSRSGTPLCLIYRACEEVRGRVATGYDDAVLWGGREADLRTVTIPSLPGSFPSFKSIRIAAWTWESYIRQLTVGVFKFFLS